MLVDSGNELAEVPSAQQKIIRSRIKIRGDRNSADGMN